MLPVPKLKGITFSSACQMVTKITRQMAVRWVKKGSIKTNEQKKEEYKEIIQLLKRYTRFAMLLRFLSMELVQFKE